MAFKFRSRSSLSASRKGSSQSDCPIKYDTTNRSSDGKGSIKQNYSKVYPPWLKDSLGLRQLPGIYQGVLGQVQLQHSFASYSGKLAVDQIDYLNKFTDTERVHQLLSTSRLPNEVLANIWNYVNQTHPGQLTNREVCLAMALIAHFQQLQKDERQLLKPDTAKDPFSIVSKEKKPPVPTLYSSYNYSISNRSMKNSKSIPGTLSSCDLLVEIAGEEDIPVHMKTGISDLALFLAHTPLVPIGSTITGPKLSTRIKQSNLLALNDIDCLKFEENLGQICGVWLRFLNALNITFKRSFDILTIKNKRQYSIEALKSRQGQEFAKNLSICYPLAHNIKVKIDELNEIRLTSGDNKTSGFLLEPGYYEQTNDLMDSIKECWAILINLLNECDQTRFIELIMDNLIRKRTNLNEAAITEIANELNGSNLICALCHSSNHLEGNLSDWPGIEDLVGKQLISNDMQYYYHVRCVNIWLNQVDSEKLPFFTPDTRN